MVEKHLSFVLLIRIQLIGVRDTRQTRMFVVSQGSRCLAMEFICPEAPYICSEARVQVAPDC